VLKVKLGISFGICGRGPEHLAQVTIHGHVPRLNQFFEELGVKYGDREVSKKFQNVVSRRLTHVRLRRKRGGWVLSVAEEGQLHGDGESLKVAAVVNLEGEGNAGEACANSDLGSQDLSPLRLVDTIVADTVDKLEAMVQPLLNLPLMFDDDDLELSLVDDVNDEKAEESVQPKVVEEEEIIEIDDDGLSSKVPPMTMELQAVVKERSSPSQGSG
jgi:hypothetical protein